MAGLVIPAIPRQEFIYSCKEENLGPPGGFDLSTWFGLANLDRND